MIDGLALKVGWAGIPWSAVPRSVGQAHHRKQYFVLVYINRIADLSQVPTQQFVLLLAGVRDTRHP